MTKSIVSVVFMSAVFALSGFGQTASPFVSKDGKFTVVPPAGFDKFESDKHNTTTDAGEVIQNRYFMSLDRGFCLMVYYDMPADFVKAKGSQKILEDFRDGAVKGRTLDNQENLTIDGYPALSFNAHMLDDKTIMYMRLVEVVANSRSYNFLYLTTDKAELTKPDVVKFFASIHIQK